MEALLCSLSSDPPALADAAAAKSGDPVKSDRYLKGIADSQAKSWEEESVVRYYPGPTP